LLDIQLGCENGLDFLRELVSTFNLARVLVLTCVTDPDVHQRAISSGATGLVLKDHAPEVLLKAIKRVHSGELWLDPLLMATMVSRRPAKQKNSDVETMARLTRREGEIVELVAEGLNNEGIARQLFISQATVKNHLTSILDKLGVTNKFELAVYALRRGLDKPSKKV
jgi:DNA-binding NarL/FixJ family response regulator